MDTFYDVNQNELIKNVAEELKENIEMPDWAKFVKTGPQNERPPLNEDWWYIRAASILRTVYLKGPIGTAKLRRKYSGRRNKGVQPDRVYKAGGKIIRTILQQLEKAELLRFKDAGVNKGRVTTKNGSDLLKKTSKKLLNKN
ncbi:MAG: 30S ribosomal protein S19e [Candidatus Woesearchaeota archaeon]